MTLKQQVESIGKAARRAADQVARASSTEKNRALELIATGLLKSRTRLRTANEKDLRAGRKSGLSGSMLDRLKLTAQRIEAMAGGAREVAELPDPVGEVLEQWTRPNGLEITKVRVPLGVVGIIYESRPNVTVDAAVLCLKSGNASILRGGSEALHSNLAIAEVLADALTAARLPKHAIQVIPTTEREAVQHLLKLDKYVDVIIPRGGKGLIETVMRESAIPVVKHYEGICHTYVDAAADLAMARAICFNAKVQRPGVCNAMETLLVHKDVAEAFLPGMCRKLARAGVEIRGCERTRALYKKARPATEEDWRTEYLDLILSVRVVPSINAAISHVAQYGSHHSDAIVTDNYHAARKFLHEVDSAAVYVNASTRFTDGYEFGLGAEIGISTNRLHCRGPMGLRELTCTKYQVCGSGQVRA